MRWRRHLSGWGRAQQIRDIQRHGAPSLHSITDTLNTRGIPTARGKTWTAMQGSNVLARAEV
jgi:hypothetical protein